MADGFGGAAVRQQMGIDQQISALLGSGEPVKCTREEYQAMRTALQEKAVELIDVGDGRFSICLSEVQRLDGMYDED